MRIGPFARLGSTTRPPCVISTSPRATNLRAAIRAGSINGCHFSPPTCRAASDGQIVAARSRELSIASIAFSSAVSLAVSRAVRQLSEQYLTVSQLRAHFARHCIARPHRTQIFSARSTTSNSALRRVESLEQGVPTEGRALDAHRKLDHATQRLNVAKFYRFVHGAFVV